jgi:tRNA pseudouridine13 synthase
MHCPPPQGRIKACAEDFVVDEISAYAPMGTGAHVFVRFTKTNLTTVDAMRMLARALSCDPREAGFAGMKDKHGVTTQTISLQAPRGTDPLDIARRAPELSLDGIQVHEAIPHGNKLKPGHLAGNRFAVVVRGIARDRVGEVTRELDRLAREGVPNAFGSQRFGAGGDNPARALAWLRGHSSGSVAGARSIPGPRDRRMARLLWSSLQSAVFNALLDARVRDGTWNSAVEGDLLKLRTSGGLFVCTDVQTDRQRARVGEISPTGPIIGARMRWPAGAPAELEREIAAQILGAEFDLTKTRSFGEGSRRALRLWVQELRWEILDDDPRNSAACVRVYFVLPKGAYATTVLAAAVTLEETRVAGGARVTDEEEEEPE